MSGKYRFSIDRGGTFTDVFAKCPDDTTVVYKLLSKHADYEDAPTEGIRHIIQTHSGVASTRVIDSSVIESIRMGTTVATNALLERNGEPTALLITKGFRDLLHIGNQARPNIFDLKIAMPDQLYTSVVEIDERIVLKSDSCGLSFNYSDKEYAVHTPLDVANVNRELTAIQASGINSIAIVYLHSWVCNAHEIQTRDIALSLGFKFVSVSSEIMNMMRIVPRGFTTVADAYTTPLIQTYVNSFKKGFTNLTPDQVLFMQSDGGLTTMNRFCGSRAVLSGPAGGVIGYAKTVFDLFNSPIIGFDMGGTSTDVSRFDGQLTHVFDSNIAGVTLQCPQIDIQTVAAGGGSILSFVNGIYGVGPESSGAVPGPVCYGKGGKNLTITDANLILNRINKHKFPKIFGPNSDEYLNYTHTYSAFETLTSKINEFNKAHGESPVDVFAVALGYIRVANETMARPIRNITQGKGYDPSSHVLCCFGGAGGQHACDIAKNLGISRVVVPKYSGILSAVGIFVADVVFEVNEPVGKTVSDSLDAIIQARFRNLKSRVVEKLSSEGTFSSITVEYYLNIRFDKTDCSVTVRGDSTLADFCTSFVAQYKQQFGFVLTNALVVDDLRVRGIGANNIATATETINKATRTVDTIECYFDGKFVKTDLTEISDGAYTGPLVLYDSVCTVLVEPDWTASVSNSVITLTYTGDFRQNVNDTNLNSITLSLFSHRFMSIAEQMGKILQRTSVSVNIKERLDFSCAIFGPDGHLVSNAPHIPVHLGAMQQAVQYQMKVSSGCECGPTHGDGCTRLYPGDVILSNHPVAGGSHLPDLTVITPVFIASSPLPVFFVANRGHHADIGGITPGSMPPNSKTIHEEGAVFKSFKLVRKSVFMEDQLVSELMKPGEYPGSSGTRNLQDNISDLKAQIAANHKGSALIESLISEYSLPYVQAYMKYIQENAEVAVRDLLVEFSNKYAPVLHATECMDDGSEIALTVTINENGNAVFDFTGTTPQVAGNSNAPVAITYSAVIYCLRCLVTRDIPLNQGCLKPIDIIIPNGCLLNPAEDAAVVGGNVLTSQRIVDVIFKAFNACAASQGCMNNITFGDESSGYYETVAGGAGAGPSWHGRSGVHTHMTNTRITDPEILESRYPVLLEHFSLVKGSGGKGKYNGGDGVKRTLQFRNNMKLSVLTERRVFTPYGLNGGGNGCKGTNTIVTKDKIINLGGKNSYNVMPGDRFVLVTPGGGGYGNEN